MRTNFFAMVLLVFFVTPALVGGTVGDIDLEALLAQYDAELGSDEEDDPTKEGGWWEGEQWYEPDTPIVLMPLHCHRERREKKKLTREEQLENDAIDALVAPLKDTSSLLTVDLAQRIRALGEHYVVGKKWGHLLYLLQQGKTVQLLFISNTGLEGELLVCNTLHALAKKYGVESECLAILKRFPKIYPSNLNRRNLPDMPPARVIVASRAAVLPLRLTIRLPAGRTPRLAPVAEDDHAEALDQLASVAALLAANDLDDGASPSTEGSGEFESFPTTPSDG